MKLNIPKIKLNWNNIFDMTVALGLVGAIGIGGFIIAQNYFSFFSYQGMQRNDVMNTVKKVEAKYPLLSRACGEDFCRGIYLTDSGLLYYRLHDDGRNMSYNLYNVPSELFTTVPSVVPTRFVGKYMSSS